MSAKKVFIGMLAGAAAGAVLGIFFAPDKGSTIRKKFSKKSYTYSEELEEKFNDLIDSITDQFQTVVEEVHHMADTERLRTEKEKSVYAKN